MVSIQGIWKFWLVVAGRVVDLKHAWGAVHVLSRWVSTMDVSFDMECNVNCFAENCSCLPDLLCFQSTHLYESNVYCTTRLPCRATDADVDADAMTNVDDAATKDGDDSDVDGDDADGKVLA